MSERPNATHRTDVPSVILSIKYANLVPLSLLRCVFLLSHLLMSFFSLFRTTALITSLMLVFSTSVRAVEIDVDETAPTAARGLKDLGTRVAAPEVSPASNEGLQALERMKLPAGLKASLWAAEPMLANPVAFNFDEQGR